MQLEPESSVTITQIRPVPDQLSSVSSGIVSTLSSLPASLTPEFRVLLACGRAAIEDTEGDLLDDSDLLAETHWPEFVDQAGRHGLAPAAHRFIAAQADLSPALQTLLRRAAISALAENLRQVHGLRLVASTFARTGLPWLCVKGPVAAATLYREPALRPFSDIDLLIHLSDFERSCANLADVGFKLYFDLTPKWQELYFRDQSQTALHAASTIDLHWQLLPSRYSFAPVMNAIWERAERVSVFNVSVDTLSPYDSLVYLCLHAAKHDWERLIWLVDIAALITRSNRLDWDAFAQDLEDVSLKVPLKVSLMLAEALFGVGLPDRISNCLRADLIAAHLCKERIKRWQEAPLSTAPWPWKSLYYRSMTLSADRRRYWHDVLLRPTPLEWKALPLPFSCRGAYYAIRPFRLMWKHWVRRSARANVNTGLRRRQ
jgi:Uncharacterised nucleotidyltransferase